MCRRLSQALLVIANLCNTVQAFSPSGATDLLILGLGRVGKEIAQNAFQQSLFTTIAGTVRNVEEDHSLDGVNIIPFQNKHIQAILPRCSHILITLPPPRVQDDELDAVLESINKYFPRNGWIGLISTTGVYGNHNGSWVTEESTCNAISESARLFLKWEYDFQEKCHRNGHQLAVFRCAGIYGPSRSALHTEFKRGPRARDSETPSSTFVTNRIHTQDLSRAVLSCMIKSHVSCQSERSEPIGNCDVFNLADDLPESRSVVLGYARDLLTTAGLFNTSILSESKFDATVTSNRARRRETDEKRVSNRRMKDILLDGDGLIYPTYKEGLAQIFRQPSEPWWKRKDNET